MKIPTMIRTREIAYAGITTAMVDIKPPTETVLALQLR